MDIERYLNAYEAYRDTVLGLKRALSRRIAGQRNKELPVGEMIDFLDYDGMTKEYEKKKRILSHATRRLQSAISDIRDVRLYNYLFCRYLCCMTNDEISESFSYCQRQIYRIAKDAKAELKKHLIPRMPRVRRGDRGRHFSFRQKRPVRSHRKYGRKARG